MSVLSRSPRLGRTATSPSGRRTGGSRVEAPPVGPRSPARVERTPIARRTPCGDPPLLGDQLGRESLGRARPGPRSAATISGERPGDPGLRDRGAHRHAGHDSTPRRRRGRGGRRRHRRRRSGRPAGGAALPVDGGAGHDSGHPAAARRCARRCALLADLRHAADEGRRRRGPGRRRCARRGRAASRPPGRRVPVLELPVALPERGADGVDDDGGGHGSSLDRVVGVPLP